MSKVTAKELEEAIELLPKVFVPIDEDFKKEHEVSLSVIRDFLADKGKLQLLEVDDRQILARIPNQQMFTEIKKRSEKLDSFQADSLLVARCVYYPKIDVIESWVAQGQPGLMTAFAARVMELGLINIRATAKEF
jgi:hypothetical protein